MHLSRVEQVDSRHQRPNGAQMTVGKPAVPPPFFQSCLSPSASPLFLLLPSLASNPQLQLLECRQQHRHRVSADLSRRAAPGA